MAATKAEDGIERCGSRLLIKGELGGRQQLSPLLGQMLVSRMLEVGVRQAERVVKRSGVVAGCYFCIAVRVLQEIEQIEHDRQNKANAPARCARAPRA
jgi:hypothetical protein